MPRGSATNWALVVASSVPSWAQSGHCAVFASWGPVHVSIGEGAVASGFTAFHFERVAAMFRNPLVVIIRLDACWLPGVILAPIDLVCLKAIIPWKIIDFDASESSHASSLFIWLVFVVDRVGQQLSA